MKRNLLKKYLFYFLPIFLVFFILIGSISFYVYHDEKDRILEAHVNYYTDYLSQRNDLIRSLFTSSINDLEFLAINTSVIDYMSLDNSSSKVELLDVMESLANQNWNYKQIRFIDFSGVERIRLNWVNDELEVVSPERLQNKSGRDYFEKTSKLPEGKIYVSPIDLNIERGRIELPHQRVIRFGTPIYSRDSDLVGVVVINQYLNDLFEWLTKNDDTWERDFMLLNSNGYWLTSSDDQFQYGFMFDDKLNENFMNYYPEVWQLLENNKVGNIIQDNNLFVFRHFSLDYDLKNNMILEDNEIISDPANNWITVIRIRLSELPELNEIRRLFILSLIASFLIICGISYLLSHLLVKRNQLVAQLSHLNNSLEKQVQARTAELLRSNENLEIANDELESFAYSVSHDLRAPLRRIISFSKHITTKFEGKLSADESVYLRYIEESATEMNHLIQELLSFSRITRSDLNKRNFDMNILVAECRKTVEDDFSSRVIAWEIKSLPSVFGDPALLRQVWINLLNNAIKYSSKTEISKIEVRCTTTEKEHIFAVKDNGVGFDEKYKDKLFSTFQRLHSAEEFEGVGVGLAIVRKIIIRHGGRIWAKSKPGDGATFFFSLPVV
ncbi:sensor histidine kinase [Sunxiuqinia indica]|uniref:sensor histidine kinase n=1 Tax=Sunxiuqinia indica TaxID=2692584 RepID=UPI001356F247|nr:sensor histidine kinase [Sunxiuqinia indica]